MNFKLSTSLLVITFLQIREMESTFLANGLGFITLWIESVSHMLSVIPASLISLCKCGSNLDLPDFTCLTPTAGLFMGPIRDWVGVMVHLQHFEVFVWFNHCSLCLLGLKGVEKVFGFASIDFETECCVVLGR